MKAPHFNVVYVVCVRTGQVYPGIRSAAKAHGLKYDQVRGSLHSSLLPESFRYATEEEIERSKGSR